MKGMIVVMPCCSLDIHGGFGLLIDVSLLDLLFNPEDVGDTFLRDVGEHLLNYTALQPR
jgi:hypothetical protein